MHRAFLPTGPGLRGGLLLGVLLLAGSALLPARPTFGQATTYRKPATQRLVFAYYHYDYQADPRKPSPVNAVREVSGRSLLTNHPWDSVGPWMSHDRSQWHKNNFQLMAGGGIDVALAVYRGDAASRRTWALRGLQLMAQGLRELRTEGLAPLAKVRDYPLIGMTLDLSGLAAAYGGPVDLSDPDVQKSLYGMVRDFYRQVPEEFRATVPLRPEQEAELAAMDLPIASIARGTAYVVQLIGDRSVRKADAGVWKNLTRRFAGEFGAGLVWAGTPELQKLAGGLDAITPYPAAQAAAVHSEGWIRTGSLGPGLDRTATHPGTAIQSRENGARLRDEMQTLLQAQPDWLFIDSWNGYQDGTDIAPSLEHGLLYRDLLRGGILEFKQTARSLDYAATFLKAWAPRVLPAGAVSQVEVLVQNAGNMDWNDENGVSLSYRWLQGGKVIPTDWTVIPSKGQLHGETRSFVIGVAPPQVEGKPLPAGEYELEFGMVRPEGFSWKRFDQEALAPFRLPIRVGGAEGGAYWISSTLPVGLRAGATYPVQVRLRNDGSTSWKKGAVSIGYRWSRIASYLKGATEDRLDPAGDGVFTPLTEDLPPGRITTLDVPVTASDAAGKPLPVSSASPDTQYQLEWLVRDAMPASHRSVPFREPVEILARDPAPSFLGSSLVTELISGRRETITIGIRNNGPELWKKDRDHVAVHWYYLDGTAASWNDASLPLPEDVPPFSRIEVEVPLDRPLSVPAEGMNPKDRKKGEPRPKFRKETLTRDTVLRDVPVRVPYYFGPMYVVFDFSFDGVHASTLPVSKGNDLLVVPVNVYSPTFSPVPLHGQYNVDGVSEDVDRRDGNIDGRGNSFPAEYLPPYVSRPAGVGIPPAPNPLYPAGLWVRPLNDFDQPRCGFMFPGKAGSQPNMMAADGQRLLVPPQARTAVHLMAACTETDVEGEFTLYYQDGTQERKKVAFTHWNEAPRHGERVAFVTPHRHTPGGDDTETRCYLHHHIMKADPARTLVALEMPRRRAIKVMAVTLESSSVQSQ